MCSRRAPLAALAIIAALGVVALLRPRSPAVNPDPNHTHADFAIWIDGQQLDFHDSNYMTTEAEEEKLPSGDVRHYLHLHDGNGHVIHRHKPGLTFGDFLRSIGLPMGGGCLLLDDNQSRRFASFMERRGLTIFALCRAEKDKFAWHMFVNGVERPMDPGYVFSDGDKIILVYTTGNNFSKELNAMTDDACLYSKTCPERGKPPTENCIADPAVPCMAPH